MTEAPVDKACALVAIRQGGRHQRASTGLFATGKHWSSRPRPRQSGSSQ